MDEEGPSRRGQFLDKRAMGRLQNTLKQKSIGMMKQKTHGNRGNNRPYRGGGGGRGRPPGLSGREIGMYYRQLSLQKKKDEEERLEAAVTLPPQIIEKVDQLLKDYEKTSDTKYTSEFEKYFKSIRSEDLEEFLASNRSDSGYQRRDEEFDEKLQNVCEEMMKNPKYIENLDVRKKLPVFSRKEEILKAVEENQVILVCGDTGCGKTTQIPQFVLDKHLLDGKGSSCNIFCTQPRRISAITVAERVAWERAERLGESAGYQIRLESVKPRDLGSVTYCTTGILLKRIESDPLLNGISHVFLDEVHERDVDTDIVIGLLKRILKHRTDMKVILMSATFNTEAFSKYFNNCLTIHVQGTLYPVKELFLEDVLEEIGFNRFPQGSKKPEPKWAKYRKNKSFEVVNDFSGFIEPYARSIQGDYSKFVLEAIKNPNSEEINIDLLCELIFHIAYKKPDGAILVFLPGYDTISKLHTQLMKSTRYARDRFRIYPLHSMMPTADQKSVFLRPPANVRKVIIATNIAETSITVDDVVYVIDSGKSKMTNYEIETKLQTLKATWASVANIRQRKGRAGRVQPGICYHLFTRAREFTMEQYPIPEILRTRLESLILNLKMLRINDVEEFLGTLINTPDSSIVESSIDLLKRLNALDNKEFITPLGLHLARLPLDPQTGKMILMASLFNCIDPISTVAANLTFKDAFYRPLGKEKLVDEIRVEFSEGTKSDHLMMNNVMLGFRQARQTSRDHNFCYDNFLSETTLRQLENMKKQFCDLLLQAKFIPDAKPDSDENNQNSSNVSLLRSIIAAGLYPNIAQLKKVKVIRNRVDPVINLITPEDGRVSFHPSSINSKQREFESRFFVYFMKQKSSAIFLFDATMVHPLALLIFGDGVHEGHDVHDNCFISLANHYRFKTNQASIQTILKLRQKLEELLEKKAICPTPIVPGSSEESLISAIISVLSIHRYGDDSSFPSTEGDSEDDNTY